MTPKQYLYTCEKLKA